MVMISALAISFSPSVSMAGGPAATETEQAPPKPKDDTVLATAGETTITVQDLIDTMDRFKVPINDRDYRSEQILNALIERQINRTFLAEYKIKITEKQVQEMLIERIGKHATIDWYMKEHTLTKMEVFDDARNSMLEKQVASKEKITTYIKTNPGYFKRDCISGWLLLLECPFTMPSSQQKAALENMQQIIREIQAAKLTLDAVQEKYPMLQVREIDGLTFNMNPMITPSAFDTAVGNFASIVRVGEGFAVIKVTGRFSLAESIARKILQVSGTEPTPELIKKVLAKYPEYVDGTEVTASHILALAKSKDPKANRAKAKELILKVQAELKAGKITFAEAAKKYSQGPSAVKGGDLGAFTFEKMVVPFAKAAFKLKVGEVSKIVETQFGYHLIQVTKKQSPADLADKVAKRREEDRNLAAQDALIGELRLKLFSLPLSTCPVTTPYDDTAKEEDDEETELSPN